MKIICERNQLIKGINTVLKAVSSKTTMDILKCILIEAYQGNIKMTANDTELGIETFVDGIIREEGEIALEAKLFAEIIKKSPDNDVTIESDENFKTQISCEQIHCTIMGMNGYDFTRLPEIEKEKRIVISQFDLKEMINQTIFSISTNENNKLMTGELINVENNKISITSLDGHRISIRNKILESEYEKTEVIVPGKTLSEVSKILPGEAEDTVNIYITDKHISFEFENTKIVSRLLEGKFYNISHMLSADYETKITINRMELLHCLDRSTLFVKETDKKPIILKITEFDMNLMISSEIGSMQDQIMIVKEGKDLNIGFNPRFLVDALRVIDDETVDIYMINPIAPCIIKDENLSYLYIILPINVNNAGL